jgi:hypothetical protein
MASIFNGDLRQLALKARSNGANRTTTYSFEKVQLSLKADQIVYRLVRKYGATQFRPANVGQMIDFLNKRYNASIRYYLDLCAGWGDREVGAFAAASSLGLKRYVATDPNVSLHEGYEQLISLHKPEGFEVVLYQKPMEDCEVQELCPKGVKNDLMYTSPPYFNLELYDGSNQSTQRYAEYQIWLEKFLYRLIHQSIASVNVGGFIVIDIGKCRSINIPGDLYNYLSRCVFLTMLGTFTAKLDSTYTYVVQLKGDWEIELSRSILCSDNEQVPSQNTGDDNNLTNAEKPEIKPNAGVLVGQNQYGLWNKSAQSDSFQTGKGIQTRPMY